MDLLATARRAALLLLCSAGLAWGEQRVWLTLEGPADRSLIEGPAGVVEVRGLAGTGSPVVHDVVIVIDASGSTLLASGADIDGDGRIGRSSPSLRRTLLRGYRSTGSWSNQKLSSDPDDTVLMAELAGARSLLQQLHPEHTRVGLVTFRQTGRIQAPLSHDRTELEEILGRVQEYAGYASGGTNFASALRQALAVLGKPRRDDPGVDTRRSILFLSDGMPTLPAGDPEGKALEAAAKVAAADARIYAFAIGEEAIAHFGVYTEMAEATGGRMRRVEQPGDVVHELPRVELAGLAGVRVRNLSADEDGRALRVFPDGSFDAFVKLVPGENHLRVVASAEGGGAAFADLFVFYDPRPPVDAAEAERFRMQVEELQARLQAREVEIRLRNEMKASRGKMTREVELAPDGATP